MIRSFDRQSDARKPEPRLARRRGRRGNAIVEATLMTPWILLLFLGVYDFGFFIYASICVQNAARVAAMGNALEGGVDQTAACNLVLNEMSSLPNITLGTTTCSTSLGVTNANPLAVVVVLDTSGPDGNANVIEVTVQYLSLQLFPIPGLMGQMTMTRTAIVPILNPQLQ